MSFTRAVPLMDLSTANPADVIGDGRPACPACKTGRLHPYEVSFRLNGGGIGSLSGWVAVCVGNQPEGRSRPRGFGEAPAEPPASEPCGFTMPLTPRLAPDRD